MSFTLHNLCELARYAEGKECPKQMGSYDITHVLRYAHELDDAVQKYYLDANSREILAWLIKYKAALSLLPFEDTKSLPGAPYSEEKWNSLIEEATRLRPGFFDNDYILEAVQIWLLHSYELEGFCKAQEGDIVLDCGAYKGNTPLYFSQLVGKKGKVYAFEPGPRIYSHLKENVASLRNVAPINAAISAKSGKVCFSETGCGSHISSSGIEVNALSIDEFLRGLKKNERVDFIKMDIEGAEADALRGAAETIKKFRPRMAISAYHKPEDIFELPQIINNIAPGYSFKLGHYSHCVWETVLFCSTDSAVGSAKEEALPLPPTPDPASIEHFLGALSKYFKWQIGTNDILRETCVQVYKTMKEENEKLKEEVARLKRS